MKISSEPMANPTFSRVEYELAPDCKGQIISDIVGTLPTSYELYDGKRWYCVPEEVFRLWIKAYEFGTKDGK